MIALVQLADKVGSSEEGLNTRIQQGRAFFSVGEKQLFCMARAMLRNSPIFVLDEATANVDEKTDALIQQTLRGPRFAYKTVLTIAHRLNTVIDYDWIIVLEHGTVAESGPPRELLKNEKGLFYQMVSAIQLNKN